MTWLFQTYLLKRLLDLSVQRPYILTSVFVLVSGVLLAVSYLDSARFGRQLGESTTVRTGIEFTKAEADLIANSYSKFFAIAILDETPNGVALNELFDDDSGGLTVAELVEHELNELEELIAADDLEYIGVVDLDGRNLWSLGDDSDVPKDFEPFQRARSGETVAFLTRDAIVGGGRSDVVTADLIESYVPFSLHANGAPEAVLHLAKDVTGILATNIAITESSVRSTALMRVAVLLAILSLFVFILDLSVMRMYRSTVAAERLRNAKLRQLDEAKNEFLSSLSHELKTPLAAILGFTRILKANKKGNLHEREIKQLQIVDRNGVRLDSLINDLLDLSRVQSRNIGLKREMTELRDLIQSTVDGLLTILRDRQQIVSLNLDHTEVWMDLDQTRIAQVLTNLISNASKYSPEGSTVAVTSTLDGDDWVLKVQDQGHGIPVEQQEQLFTLFYRTPDARASATPGTGIGLYVSKQIIDMHEGHIGLNSSPGEGTTVTVRLSGLIESRFGLADEPQAFGNAFDALDKAV